MNEFFDTSVDIEQSIEQQAQVEHKKLIEGQSKGLTGDGAVKLTPAQRRDALFAEITDAINQSDFSTVTQIFHNNPKLSLKVGSTDAIFQALLENFDKDTANTLIAKEMNFPLPNVMEALEKRTDTELLEFALARADKSQYPQWHNNFQHIVYFYAKCFEAFSSKTPAKLRERKKIYLDIIDQHEDDIIGQSQSHITHQIGLMVLQNYKTLPADDLNYIQNTNIDWSEVCSAYFQSFNERGLSAQDVKSLLSFYNDMPAFQASWKDYWNSQKEQRKQFNAFLDKYFQEDTLWRDTKFIKTIEKHTPTQQFGGGRDAVQEPEAEKHLKLSVRELVERKGKRTFYIQTYYLDQNCPVRDIPEQGSVSFLGNMIQYGHDCSLVLLEHEKTTALYQDMLMNDAVARYHWCNNASQSLINAVIKACPELKTWSDRHGNHLAHHLVAVRKEKSKSFVQLLAKLHHEWFQEDNNHKVSLQDVFEANGATKDAQALIEKETMKRSMRDAGINTRSKPTQKRRM